MSRPTRIPASGDVSVDIVALALGLSVGEFEQKRRDLATRNFPEPDPTTGRYAIEAVHRWRLRRYPKLFPELTAAPTALDARVVFDERMRRLG